MDVEVPSWSEFVEARNAAIVSATIDGSGNLKFTNGAGDVSNAGKVASSLSAWPVGSIFVGTTSTSPATLLGGGAWSRFAQGKVLVGLDETDTDFDTALETRGEKRVTLSANEMPAHDHGAVTGNDSPDHAHGATTDFAGSHSHSYAKAAGDQNVDASEGAGTAMDNNYNNTQTATDGGHSHAVSVGGATARHQHTIGSAGGGASHNNIQPSIVVYMWRRTA